MYYITKRDGRIKEYNRRKIENAIAAAFNDVDGKVDDYAEAKITSITDYVEEKIKASDHPLGVEEIQDLVENGLMNTKRKDVARSYITYRNERTRLRANPIDDIISEIADNKNEYWKRENSNKNSKVVTTQRDYFAGAISTDFTMRKLLPRDIVEAYSDILRKPGEPIIYRVSI